MIENGQLRKEQTRAFIELDDDLSVIALNYKGEPSNWILTAYKKDDALNPAYLHQTKHNTNTSSETRASGDNAIIPQPHNALQALEQYAPNLADAARLNNLNKDLQALAHNFKATNTDKENAKLFDRALIVAQQLGVKVNLNASTTKKGH